MFWRNTALSKEEELLVKETCEAHTRSAMRANPSSEAARNSALASGDYTKSIASALLTLGGKHAPIRETMEFLDNQDIELVANLILNAGEMIPGWGNSFVKNEPDPFWIKVDDALCAFPEVYDRITKVTALLNKEGRNLFPNPSAYTAAVNIVIGVPREIAEILFLKFRIDSWSFIHYSNI